MARELKNITIGSAAAVGGEVMNRDRLRAIGALLCVAMLFSGGILVNAQAIDLPAKVQFTVDSSVIAAQLAGTARPESRSRIRAGILWSFNPWMMQQG